MILPTNRFVVQFLSRITEDENGCWLWQGMIDKTGGYPRWYAGDTEDRWAHRLAFKLASGVIPPGWHIDHLCFVRRCVNPAHLEAVPPLVNSRRASSRIPWVHGTRAYSRGCRCVVCVAAVNADSSRRRREMKDRVAAGLHELRHGSVHSYSLGCRCNECSRVALAKAEEYRRRRGVKPFKPTEHGTTSMYTKHKCRCDECKAEWSRYWIEYRRKKRAGGAAEAKGTAA